MKKQKLFHLLIAVLLVFPFTGVCQSIEKVSFDPSDSTGNGYYLAISPAANHIKGALVLLCSFNKPESLLPETKLHNVASANDLLTIYVSMGKKLYADAAAVDRINAVLKHVVTKYGADSSKFVLGGFDFGGTIALRYTELTYERPSQFLVHPKAVFGIASFADLFGLWHWGERQIKTHPGMPGDANIILDMMTKENGTIYNKPENYKSLTPFYTADTVAGNEQYLKDIPVRLYYDIDIAWQLASRRNSFYDTNIPDGSEFIKRLLFLRNNEAEFIASKQPGMRSNGMRNATSLSIVDETDCIQWIKRKLHIFDPGNAGAWEPTYKFPLLNGWRLERILPQVIAPQITFQGIEEVHLPAGWGDAGSNEYWSVAYLLWLDAGQNIDADALRDNLKFYYESFVAGNVKRRNIPKNKVVPTQVKIEKIKAESDDMETYSGTIHMLDYMAQKPITLNCLVHIKNCAGQNHAAVFFEISPKPFDNVIWLNLKNMKQNFDCGK